MKFKSIFLVISLFFAATVQAQEGVGLKCTLLESESETGVSYQDMNATFDMHYYILEGRAHFHTTNGHYFKKWADPIKGKSAVFRYYDDSTRRTQPDYQPFEYVNVTEREEFIFDFTTNQGSYSFYSYECPGNFLASFICFDIRKYNSTFTCQ